VAIYVLNQKREDLATLEQRYDARIQIAMNEKLMPHQSELEVKTRVDTPAPAKGPRPGEVVKTELPAVETVKEAAADNGNGAATAGEEKDANGEGKKKRRRRGRRRGRGRGKQAAAALADALSTLGAHAGLRPLASEAGDLTGPSGPSAAADGEAPAEALAARSSGHARHEPRAAESDVPAIETPGRRPTPTPLVELGHEPNTNASEAAAGMGETDVGAAPRRSRRGGASRSRGRSGAGTARGRAKATPVAAESAAATSARTAKAKASTKSGTAKTRSTPAKRPSRRGRGTKKSEPKKSEE
jgi:ribonuclease E